MFAPMLPENAPFSSEQRAWLDGFFAGLLSLDGDGRAIVAANVNTAPGIAPALAAATALEAPADPLADGDDGEAPWHDQTMPMAERMKLAEGRPVRRRMMAAMAQQDCGQCGYTCEDYSNKLFLGDEKRLNLCVPGGKETSRMLKSLYAEVGAAAASAPAPAAAPASAGKIEDRAPGRSRENPVLATFLGTRVLNAEGSEKETRHVDFDLDGTGLDYRPGDSFGIVPSNDPELADAIIRQLGCHAETQVGDGNGHSRTLRDALIEDAALWPAPDALFELLATLATDPAQRAKLTAMSQGDDPDGDLDCLDVLAALEKFPALVPAPRALLAALDPLQPRLYSTFLADRLGPGARLPVYVQASHAFGLPADPATPIIMCGPGTGVAPFRSFLHERRVTPGYGPAWLFFGHQREACDFFYKDEFAELMQAGVLTRLSTAFSRDQERKIYVQDRMVEEGAELYRWLEDGAWFYVCGDAKRMAPDVDRALHRVVAEHGGKGEDGARAYIAALTAAGRYRKDVY